MDLDIVNTPYWVFEFIKVIIGYLLVGFAWPRFVFAKHLHEKSMIYKFSFCVTVQTVLVNTVVLCLGLLHLLNNWTVRAVFYGVPLVVLYRRVRPSVEQVERWLRILTSNRLKTLFTWLYRWVMERGRRMARTLRAHLPEYLLLGAISVYALIYFSWGAFQVHSYGSGDQYVHHSRIYGLIQGQIFYGGVYPEAMHCLIYAIHTLLGVRAYSLMLFFGSIQGVVFLIAVYCLCREIFGCRYTPFFVLAAMILFKADVDGTLKGMARLQWTLPLEFGLAPQFLCVMFLIRYLREEQKPREEGRFAGYILGTDLFLFAMALAGMMVSHFYPVIMASFMCLGVAVFFFQRVFSRERFLPLVAAVLGAICVAVAPMLGALASGIPFQSSMDRAMQSIDATDGEARGKAYELYEMEERLQEGQLSTAKQLSLIVTTIGDLLHRGFMEMSGKMFSGWLMAIIPSVLAAYPIIKSVLRRKGISIIGWSQKRGIASLRLDAYCMLAIISVCLYVLYIAPYFGLPEWVLGAHIGSTIRAVFLMIMAIPLDAGLIFLSGWVKNAGIQAIFAVCLGAVCIWSCKEGNYHGYLFYELTRYPSDVAVMNQIIHDYPRDTYTVVSPADGRYQVIEYGRHEELPAFVQGVEEDRYSLSTEHVFIFVEKKPLDYAQLYCLAGPAWLATEGDASLIRGSTEIRASEISKEAAEKKLPRMRTALNNDKVLENRTIVESKAYYWCQRFMELYPYEMNVYYEDEDLVCYHFLQEPNAPYDLTIAYE